MPLKHYLSALLITLSLTSIEIVFSASVNDCYNNCQRETSNSEDICRTICDCLDSCNQERHCYDRKDSVCLDVCEAECEKEYSEDPQKHSSY